ncbi:hypothetical protein HA466_0107660 [Hirschfeldia incana]|nr:hypothetical protein HA466_0107660 [Hirschfeldia incana]
MISSLLVEVSVFKRLSSRNPAAAAATRRKLLRPTSPPPRTTAAPLSREPPAAETTAGAATAEGVGSPTVSNLAPRTTSTQFPVYTPFSALSPMEKNKARNGSKNSPFEFNKRRADGLYELGNDFTPFGGDLMRELRMALLMQITNIESGSGLLVVLQDNQHCLLYDDDG